MRSVLTILAAVVVFITTYALIIPAITWERTLICPLEEHVHTDFCYDSKGELRCGKEEHKHTDACFDAPKGNDKEFFCGKTEHTHTEDCYFADGKLRCTISEHTHSAQCRIKTDNNLKIRTIISAPAYDGAVAAVTGAIPEGAEVRITAVSFSADDLAAYFGEEKAASMTSYVAYDIKIFVDGMEWQPDDSVSVTVEHLDIDAPADGLAVAHIKSDDSSVAAVRSQVNEDGNLCFHTDGFSVYVFYVFTVDYYFGDGEYHQPGMTSMDLSDLFAELKIDRLTEEIASVRFTDPELLQIEAVDGDWTLTSLRAFESAEILTVRFNDGTEIGINVFDATSVKITVNENYNLVTRFTPAEELLKAFGVRSELSGYGITDTTAIRSVTVGPNNLNTTAATVNDVRGIQCTTSSATSRTVTIEFNQVDSEGNYIACTFTDVTSYTDDLFTMWDYSNIASRPQEIRGDFNNLIDSPAIGLLGIPYSWNTGISINNLPNAPIGSGTVITNKGTALDDNLVIDGVECCIYVARKGNLGNMAQTTRQADSLPCVYVSIPYVAWIEDAAGNKLIMPDVCLGNQGANNKWYWQFGGRGNKYIYTNDDRGLTWDGTWGTVVHDDGDFQGIQPDENGYYSFMISNRSNPTGAFGTYDEISVFRFSTSADVKKKVLDEKGNPISDKEDEFDFWIKYKPRTSTSPTEDDVDFKLKNGDDHPFFGIIDKEYTVWEVVDQDYVTTIKLNGTIQETVTETVKIKGKDYDVIRLKSTPTFKNNEDTIIEFVNQKKPKKLTIEKKVNGGVLDETVPFTIRITAKDKNSNAPADLKRFEGDVDKASVSNVKFIESTTGSGIYDIVTFDILHNGHFTIPLFNDMSVEIEELSHDGWCPKIKAKVTDSGDPYGNLVIGDKYTLTQMPKFDVTVTVTNNLSVVLPATGGNGVCPIVITGICLIAIPLIYFVLNPRRKRERRTEE